jgi:hypothetical protein
MSQSLMSMDYTKICFRGMGWSYRLDRLVRFEVFTAVTMKNGVFWDVNDVWPL